MKLIIRFLLVAFFLFVVQAGHAQEPSEENPPTNLQMYPDLGNAANGVSGDGKKEKTLESQVRADSPYQCQITVDSNPMFTAYMNTRTCSNLQIIFKSVEQATLDAMKGPMSPESLLGENDFKAMVRQIGDTAPMMYQSLFKPFGACVDWSIANMDCWCGVNIGSFFGAEFSIPIMPAISYRVGDVVSEAGNYGQSDRVPSLYFKLQRSAMRLVDDRLGLAKFAVWGWLKWMGVSGAPVEVPKTESDFERFDSDPNTVYGRNFVNIGMRMLYELEYQALKKYGGGRYPVHNRKMTSLMFTPAAWWMQEGIEGALARNPLTTLAMMPYQRKDKKKRVLLDRASYFLPAAAAYMRMNPSYCFQRASLEAPLDFKERFHGVVFPGLMNPLTAPEFARYMQERKDPRYRTDPCMDFHGESLVPLSPYFAHGEYRRSEEAATLRSLILSGYFYIPINQNIVASAGGAAGEAGSDANGAGFGTDAEQAAGISDAMSEVGGSLQGVIGAIPGRGDKNKIWQDILGTGIGPDTFRNPSSLIGAVIKGEFSPDKIKGMIGRIPTSTDQLKGIVSGQLGDLNNKLGDFGDAIGNLGDSISGDALGQLKGDLKAAPGETLNSLANFKMPLGGMFRYANDKRPMTDKYREMGLEPKGWLRRITDTKLAIGGAGGLEKIKNTCTEWAMPTFTTGNRPGYDDANRQRNPLNDVYAWGQWRGVLGCPRGLVPVFSCKEKARDGS
jgi:hypothetical protein